jgi:hypothetical protein
VTQPRRLEPPLADTGDGSVINVLADAAAQACLLHLPLNTDKDLHDLDAVEARDIEPGEVRPDLPHFLGHPPALEIDTRALVAQREYGVYRGAGRFTRSFREVAVTRQAAHDSTSSIRNSVATRSESAARPGCGSRTMRIPW